MSFRPIRSFLSQRLLEVDKDFKVHDDAFSTANIGLNNFDKRYHIFYGNVQTSSANQNTTQDNVQAVVTLHFNGKRNATEQLDIAMDIANKFRMQCLKMQFLKAQQFIKRVACETIEAIPLDTDDNQIQIRLTFNISIIFGTGIDLDC
jgi:hypothetical protein